MEHINMTLDSLKDKIKALREENSQRVEQVKQHQAQIEQSQGAISSIKEQHDHARGKIDALSDLLETQEADAE